MLHTLIEDALFDFAKVAGLARCDFSLDRIVVEVLQGPHVPPSKLPQNYMAVYAFFFGGRTLKVGKVGLKSAARFTSQHYSPYSCKSNLARSILADRSALGGANFNDSEIGQWIQSNTDRVNLLLPEQMGMPMLSLLESFLHVRWNPLFEGRSVNNYKI